MHLYHKIKLFWIALIIASVPIVCTTINECDLFFHMNMGRDLVINQSVDYAKYYYTQVTDSYGDMRYTFLGDIILYLVDFLSTDFGLVLLRILMVGMCCYFLFLVSDKKPDFFKLLLLVLLIIGTYQKQIIRNSLFALGFLPLLFYLIDNRKYFAIIFLLTVWNFIHGSFLLGFGFLCILALCDILDNFMKGIDTRKHILLWGLCIAVSFVILSYDNPLMTSTFNIESAKNVVQSSNLNQTIFSPGGGFVSTEFKSPFKLDRWYIRVSYLIPLFTLIVVRPIRFRYILPFIAVAILGLGYVRMVGYIPIVCCYILFHAQKSGHLRQIPPYIYAIILLFTTFNIYTHTDKFLFSYAEFGFKKSYLYSDTCANVALKKYKGEPTFTTIHNGSYLSWAWYPDKRVFLDTHFAPHPPEVFEAYKLFCFDPGQLKRICRSAVISFVQPDLIKSFLRKGWYAECIDEGQVLLTTEECTPKVAVSDEQYEEMSKKHKKVYDNILRICKGEKK